MSDVLLPALRQLLAESLEIAPSVIKEDKRLREQGLDSVKATDFVVAIEEQYGIQLSDDAMGKLETLREVSRYVAQRIAEKSAS